MEVGGASGAPRPFPAPPVGRHTQASTFQACQDITDSGFAFCYHSFPADGSKGCPSNPICSRGEFSDSWKGLETGMFSTSFCGSLSGGR